MKLFIHKLRNWEYWPFWAVYFPLFFLWAAYALRARTIFFFNAANPTMRNGGFIMDSKIEIYGLMPEAYYPATILVPEGKEFDEVKQQLAHKNIAYPIIAKPDMGLRGNAVKKVYNEAQLKNYHQKADFDYLIQEFIPYPNEAGIFYVRFPGEDRGKVTGIVAKELLTVTGDGEATITELIRRDPRFEMQLPVLKKELGARLDEIPEKDKKINLVPLGNHCRGAKFIDASHLISAGLTDTINEVALQMPEFYFGRMDIMYNSWEELEQGINFSIIEVNGAASEPTHIYDPMHSIFFAWKELARHITYMFRISVKNNTRGVRYLSFSEGMHQYRLHRKMVSKYERL
ncbi:D-alanine--D-alanine ligase [Flavobacterium cyanobacteriorum]|uniref:D-alanine--D-alanine ligase n=1 Tax=Flavobacterium cyanobacteriorum TaxID=2022802 RepID=A0A255ZNK7_9FLAO|nr:D-alanine--D-alanine ligase [Flavobacterium cyanobacteriorum]OYQ43036.1 D-alanine--D-alanine ligase [Flavobacterium cyanobacteriorum]